ncbi:MAG: hypothetical protein QM811_19610 [Pirellulales bacterium]
MLLDAFFAAYRRELRTAELLPADETDLRGMLEIYILEKAIYELGYELMNRPDWVAVPLLGIHGLLTR